MPSVENMNLSLMALYCLWSLKGLLLIINKLVLLFFTVYVQFNSSPPIIPSLMLSHLFNGLNLWSSGRSLKLQPYCTCIKDANSSRMASDQHVHLYNTFSRNQTINKSTSWKSNQDVCLFQTTHIEYCYF